MDLNHPPKPPTQRRRRRRRRAAIPVGVYRVGPGGTMTHAPAATPGIPGVNELSELALWMAAGLAGMVTAMLLARGPFFRGLLRRLDRPQSSRRGNAAPPSKPPTPERSLPLLAEAIVGSSKTTVAAVLGPPRSAALAGRAPPAANASFWQADTWYYPLRERDPAAAMAVRFDEDFAHRVEFLGRPKAASHVVR